MMGCEKGRVVEPALATAAPGAVSSSILQAHSTIAGRNPAEAQAAAGQGCNEAGWQGLRRGVCCEY